MNPFVMDAKYRLSAWKSCRAEIAAQTDVDAQLDVCLKFWQQAPLENHILNWDDCTTWPSAWELLDDNSYCTSGHSLGVAYTLIWAAPDQYSDLSLRLITDRANSVQKIMVYTQGWVLNSGYLDKTSENSLQHVHTHSIWKWTGKLWQPQ